MMTYFFYLGTFTATSPNEQVGIQRYYLNNIYPLQPGG